MYYVEWLFNKYDYMSLLDLDYLYNKYKGLLSFFKKIIVTKYNVGIILTNMSIIEKFGEIDEILKELNIFETEMKEERIMKKKKKKEKNKKNGKNKDKFVKNDLDFIVGNGKEELEKNLDYKEGKEKEEFSIKKGVKEIDKNKGINDNNGGGKDHNVSNNDGGEKKNKEEIKEKNYKNLIRRKNNNTDAKPMSKDDVIAFMEEYGIVEDEEFDKEPKKVFKENKTGKSMENNFFENIIKENVLGKMYKYIEINRYKKILEIDKIRKQEKEKKEKLFMEELKNREKTLEFYFNEMFKINPELYYYIKNFEDNEKMANFIFFSNKKIDYQKLVVEEREIYKPSNRNTNRMEMSTIIFDEINGANVENRLINEFIYKENYYENIFTKKYIFKLIDDFSMGKGEQKNKTIYKNIKKCLIKDILYLYLCNKKSNTFKYDRVNLVENLMDLFIKKHQIKIKNLKNFENNFIELSKFDTLNFLKK